MTELPLIGGQINAKHPRDLCSAALWRYLTESPAASGAANSVAWNPKLREEVRDVRERFQAMTGPIGAERLLERLAAMAPGYGLPDMDPDALTGLLRPYVAELMHLPVACFEDAVERWNAGEGMKKSPESARFIFPRPDQLHALAKPSLTEIATAAWRFRKAVEAIEKLPPPKRERPTKADLIAQGILDSEGRAILTKTAPADIPEAF